MKISIIIPVYNEDTLISNVLKELEVIRFPDEITAREIIVVDDRSEDDTVKAVNEFIKNSSSNIQLIHHEKNRGKGVAVRSGIEKSTGNLIVIQDADMELIPSDLPLMVQTMFDLDVQFINGSRYMPGIIRPLYSYKRYFFNKLFTKFASVLINVRLTDLACGYKLFTKSVYDQIKLRENRFGFEAELLIKVARLKKTSIAEVPVHYFPRNIGEGKKIRNTDGFKILWTIIKYGLLKRD